MKGTTKSKGIGIAAITALLAALLIAAVIAPAMAGEDMAGEEGTRSTEISGGQLDVDEAGGITCTADADDHDLTYIPGRTYEIVTDYDYIDTASVWSETAYFRVTGPDGSTDDKSIYDRLGFDDSKEGTISVRWSPSGPGTYHYTIYCSEGGESATDIGDITLT